MVKLRTRRQAITSTGVALLTGLAGCSVSTTPEADLSHSRIRWRNHVSARDISVLDDAVYVSASTDLHSYAVDSGREKWSRHVEDEPRLHSEESTCLGRETVTDGERLYVPGCEGVHAFSLSDGSRIWTSGSTAVGSIALADGTVFEGGTSVRSVASESGTIDWTSQTDAESHVAIAASGDGVVACDETAGTVYTFDVDGTERWQYDLEWSGRPPVIADDTVYVASVRRQRSGRLTALSLADGTVRWTTETGPVTPRGPALGDGAVYVGCYPDDDREGRIVSHAMTDGERQWDYEAADTDFSRPAVDSKGVYAGTDGALYAFTHDGDVRWRIDTGYPTYINAIGDGTVYATATQFLFAADAT